MVLWSAWLPDILPHVAECPVMVAEHELRRAAQEFFERSRAWLVRLAPIPIVAGTDYVTVPVADPAEQSLVRVETGLYDDKRMDIFTVDGMDDVSVGDWHARVGTPDALVQYQPGIVRLCPLPFADATTGLALRVALRPSDAATGIPDELYVKYRKAIAAGAKASLFGYPNKPWSSEPKADKFATMFDELVDKSLYGAARGFGRGRVASRTRWC